MENVITTEYSRKTTSGLTITTYENEDIETGHIYRETMLICHCTHRLWTSRGDDMACDCGREYNAYGQELRSDWRELSDY